MNRNLLFLFLLISSITFAQEDDKLEKATSLISKKPKAPKARIDQYKIISI